MTTGFSVTLKQILNSWYEDNTPYQNQGFTVRTAAEFNPPIKIIEETCDKLFENVNSPYIDKELKKAVCLEYFNREIGFETAGEFMLALSRKIDVELENLMRAYAFSIKRNLEDFLNENQLRSETLNDSLNKSLGIANTTPQGRLSITFKDDDPSNVIEYANALNEGINKGTIKSDSLRTGWSGGSLALKLYQLGRTPSIKKELIDNLDELFLGVF